VSYGGYGVVYVKTGASIGWHAGVGLVSAGLFMLVTKRGYSDVKGKDTWSTLLLPAAAGGIVGYARTRNDA